MLVKFNVSFFKTQSQVINDYVTLSKSHAPSVLILNGLSQQNKKNKTRKMSRENKIIKMRQTKVKIHDE